MVKQRLLMVFCFTLIAYYLATECLSQGEEIRLKRDYNVKPVPFNKVKVEDGFGLPVLKQAERLQFPMHLKNARRREGSGISRNQQE